MAVSTNPTSKTGTTGHCSTCKKSTHIATSAIGRRHHGVPARTTPRRVTRLPYSCGGKWVAGPAPK